MLFLFAKLNNMDRLMDIHLTLRKQNINWKKANKVPKLRN